MNDNTNFATMLKMIRDMQVPIILLESLNEKLCDEPCTTHHIVIPSGEGKVTDFCFRDGLATNNNYLFFVKSVDMSFDDAIVHFSKMALNCHSTRLTLTSV